MENQTEQPKDLNELATRFDEMSQPLLETAKKEDINFLALFLTDDGKKNGAKFQAIAKMYATEKLIYTAMMKLSEDLSHDKRIDFAGFLLIGSKIKP